MLRLFLLVFLVVTIDASPFDKKPAKFRSDYKYVEAVDGWLKLHRAPADWFDARARCQLEGCLPWFNGDKEGRQICLLVKTIHPQYLQFFHDHEISETRTPIRHGGDLASPSDEPMLQAMIYIGEESVGAHCGVYTGIHALFSKGVYTSTDGTDFWKMPVDFTNCPIEGQLNDCTVLLPSGTIDTVYCNQLRPFMCYRKNKNISNTYDCGTVDPEYRLSEKTGQCYKFHLKPKTWPEAYKSCVSEGGHLAVINSAEEAKVITSIFEQHPPDTIQSRYKDCLLLGFKKLKETWTTVHGQSLEEAGYARWSLGQPDSLRYNGELQSCGAMFRDGLLDDNWCYIEIAFICEKHPKSLLDEDKTEEVALYNQTEMNDGGNGWRM